MEQFKFDAGDYLKKKLGLEPESPEEEQKEAVEPMTIGRMEEFKELLGRIDMEAFLGQREGVYTEEKERIQKERELIKEFLSAKDGLDSNSKKKLYDHILEENWKPKLEEVFNKTSEELKELELIRKGKKEFDSLSAEEKSKFSYLSGRNTIIGYTRFLSGALQKLEEFSFDKQRLEELKERFKKVKK